MRTIINGKSYDTTTAERVGWKWNGLSLTDFNYWRGELYKKKTGEFFVLNEHWDGSSIEAMTLQEAKEWTETHNNRVYEDIFGKVEE